MPTAERVGPLIHVRTKWSEKTLIREIGGARWLPEDQLWTVPLSWAACLQLRAAFPTSLEVGPDLAAWSWREYRDRVEPALSLRSRTARVPGDFDERLYDFQTDGVEFLVIASRAQTGDPTGGALLGDDMGLGKTAQILAAISRLIRVVEQLGAAEVLPALVICPNSVKPGWEKQVRLWNTPVTPYVVSGGAAQRRKILEASAADPHALVIVNLESVRLFSRLAPYGSVRLARCRECDRRHGEETLSTSRCETHVKELNGFGFRTVVLDEAHRIKDPKSKQTRAVWAVGHDPSVRRRWALTGTPIADHVGDLWSIMHFIVPHEHPTKTRFVDRYALQGWNAYGGMEIVGINPERREEFFRIIDPRFRRTPKALVLEQLPEVVRSTRWVEMAPKQRRAYEELEHRLVTRLDDGKVLVSKNNLVNATRLLQLSSSYCDVEWLDNPDVRATDVCLCYASGLDIHAADCVNRWKLKVTLAEPSPKLDAMEEAFDELGGKPVVICAMHRQLIELAAKRFDRLKIPYSSLTGGIPDYERPNQIRNFERGFTNVMLMTIGAGGTGVDGLQVADTMFCLQRDWSMINNVQVDARVHRIGSERHSSVQIVDFVTQNSIEETVQHPRLQEKLARLEEINRDRARLLLAESRDESALYELARQESLIIASHLGEPL